MSEVNPNDQRIIRGHEDVLETYQGNGSDIKTGAEIELCFFDPATPDLKPMSAPQNRVVKNAANEALGKKWVHNEPTSEMLEVASDAYAPAELQKVMDDANQKIAILTEKAENIGLKRSYFQDLPEKSAAQLLENVVQVDRFQAFFNPPREDMMGIAAYFSVCKSNQVSVSYGDPDHLLDNIRRLYFLAPFLFLLTDNSSAFNEGKPFSGHSGMSHRSSLKKRGGIPDYVFSAKNGQDYIYSHIDDVLTQPLHVYYTRDGKMQRLPSGQWTSFKELEKEGLNTATNYYFSESVLWPDVKIAALKNKEGEVVSHRYEARMFGVGIHQHQTALFIVSGLAVKPGFARKTDRLLSEFGFDTGDLNTAQRHLKKAYRDTLNHNGKFFDIPYGTGQMIDFSKKFADLLEDAYIGENFDEALQAALSICRTGCTDGKVNRILLPGLDDIIAHQKSYDPRIYDNPNQCAHMIYKREIKALGSSACTQLAS